MDYAEFYGVNYNLMLNAEKRLVNLIDFYSSSNYINEDIKPIIYFCSRIKSPDSMMNKIKKLGFKHPTPEALNEIYDAVGIRVICAFVEDVYNFVNWLRTQKNIYIINEKNYCAYPKPNGYRSYHIQLVVDTEDMGKCRAEIQVRTLANDFWASLEHKIKYKKDIPDEKLIRSELKRCADEIASLDISMQTIRDIIKENTEHIKKTE